jgi:hypothetical protein
MIPYPLLGVENLLQWYYVLHDSLVHVTAIRGGVAVTMTTKITAWHMATALVTMTMGYEYGDHMYTYYVHITGNHNNNARVKELGLI